MIFIIVDQSIITSKKDTPENANVAASSDKVAVLSQKFGTVLQQKELALQQKQQKVDRLEKKVQHLVKALVADDSTISLAPPPSKHEILEVHFFYFRTAPGGEFELPPETLKHYKSCFFYSVL